MLRFIIVLLIISSIMGNREGARNLLRGLITIAAIVYGIRLIVYTGFHLLPLIIIIWAVVNIALPFVRGFLSGFSRKRVSAEEAPEETEVAAQEAVGMYAGPDAEDAPCTEMEVWHEGSQK